LKKETDELKEKYLKINEAKQQLEEENAVLKAQHV